jgi:SAM-dependent methyltransferase
VPVSWKIKAALQTGLSLAPNPEELNLWFQRRVTHGLPPADERILEKVGWARHHVAQYGLHGARPLRGSRFFEFGAGWDFAQALAQHALGVQEQLVVDIRRLGRTDIAEAAVASLDRLMPEFSAAPGSRGSDVQATLEGLLAAYGIEYRAPADARATGLPEGSIDCVTSTDTLEHIPPEDIAAILRECHRILSDDGIMSFRVDYRDHWAYFDRRITPVNMLQYSNRRWARYNPSLNYQNRLRHDDYARLFDAAGFTIVQNEQEPALDESREFLTRCTVAAEFRSYTLEALLVPSATFTLAKARR